MSEAQAQPMHKMVILFGVRRRYDAARPVVREQSVAGMEVAALAGLR